MHIEFGPDTTLGTIDTVLRKLHGWTLNVTYRHPSRHQATTQTGTSGASEQPPATIIGTYAGTDWTTSSLRFTEWNETTSETTSDTIHIALNSIRTITIL